MYPKGSCLLPENIDLLAFLYPKQKIIFLEIRIIDIVLVMFGLSIIIGTILGYTPVNKVYHLY